MGWREMRKKTGWRVGKELGLGGERKRKRGRNEGGKEQKESGGGVEGGKEGERNGMGEGNEKWQQVRTEKECSKGKILQ